MFVGGPEASQNGFGLVIPAKLTLKSAMRFTSAPFACTSFRAHRGAAEPSVDAARGGHAFGHRIHHFLAAVGAIAAGKIFRIAGLVPLVDSHRAILVQLDAFDGSQKIR